MAAPQKKIDSTQEYKQIAKERLAWAVKPLFLVFLVAWCLHPSTTMKGVLERNILLGFLLGAVLGILVYWDVLVFYLVTRRQESICRRNRMPEEYYFGKIKKVLQDAGLS